MKRSSILPALAALATLLATPVSAGCFADYKAKRDNPLRLHYGTIELRGESCTIEDAQAQIPQRIAADGWTLLTVLGVFDETGLAEREASAGPNHLRY